MKLSTRLLIAELVEFPLIGVILFTSAGTIDWPGGWAFWILLTGGSVVLTQWLLSYNPGVLEERMAAFRPNQKAWDKVFVTFIMLGFIGWLILMGLDAARFGWSHVPLWLSILGGLVVLCSFYLFYLTFKENPYLSATVRIQEERGQTVISTGPYSYIRHPMYAAGILFFIASALMAGSYYGALLGALMGVLLAVRAVLEERVLQAELAGYDEYMSKVRYRLIPRVW